MDWLMGIEITAPWVVWGLRVLAVLAVVLVVARWGRLARTTTVTVLLRVVSLVVVAVLGALALAAPINAQYGWYPTVGDLFPSTGTAISASAGAAPASAVTAEITSSALITGERHRPADPFTGESALRPTRTRSGAGYADFTVPGPRSGVSNTVTVWFPAEYTEDPQAEFPVLMAYHGIEPAPYAYFNVVKLDQTIERMVAEGRLRPAIVVVPHWAVGGLDNECASSVQGGDVETWLTEDIPAWVYATFRAAPGRDAFAGLGLSAGGYCANMAAMLHPDTFSTAISLGGYWRPIFDAPFIPFGPGTAPWAHYDLVARAKSSAPPVALWTLYGASDRLAVPTTTELKAVVRAPTSFTETRLSRGGHNTDVWLPYVPQSLEWLGTHSPGFTPSSPAAHGDSSQGARA